jgi:penicillin V acylase-like amidase (Ntn superfamily)
MSRRTALACLLVALAALAVNTAAIAADQVRYKETVVAGGPDAFMEVRHVVIGGTNFEIGRKLAELAKAAGFSPRPSQDTLTPRVQRQYIQQNYPVLYERMRGMADGLGVDIGDDRYDLSNIFFVPSARPGCSVVFYPAADTDAGHDMLSRNYDFTTGNLTGRRTAPGELAAMARPYIIELHPDQGYASLAICAFDLLGGVLDGINSQGLAVAILADDETIHAQGLEATQGIGMHELASMRYLLDNCRDVPEAKAALLSLKHFYFFIPCHYIVGDSSGRSFVFEFYPQRNRVAIVDGEGPQCITNHPVSKYASLDDLPQGDSYDRYRALRQAATSRPVMSTQEIIAANASVAATPDFPGNAQYAPGRTIWYSLYDLDQRTMKVKFYLGEKLDPADPGTALLEYSDYLEFRLGDT